MIKKRRSLYFSISIFSAFAWFFCGNVIAQEVHLSSIKPVFSTQRIGKLTTDTDSNGYVPQIDGRTFKFGLNTCFNSEVIYILNGKYKHFTAWVGLENSARQTGKSKAGVKYIEEGKVSFEVYADGNKIFDSGIMGIETPARQLNLDISNIKELELIVRDQNTGGNPNHSINTAKVNWADPVLIKAIANNSVTTGTAFYEIRGGNGTTIKLDHNGKIISMFSGANQKPVALQGNTKLSQCREIKLLKAQKLSGGGMQFSHLVEDKNGNQCILTERFKPTANSVRWEVDIEGYGKPWTAAVITSLKWPVNNNTRFWTSWSNPDLFGQGHWNHVMQKTEWVDPLQTRPFTNSSRWFGGNPTMYLPTSGDIFSIPISTVLDGQTKSGFSLVQSPQDSLLYMKLITTTDGSMEFQRRYHRIAKGKHVRFALDLINHEDDWRGGLEWMVKRYPEYFEPTIAKAYDVGGCGAYSSWEGELDTAKLKKMAFRTNWKASFDFPYMGMFLPPVEKWQTFATSAEATKDPWVKTPYKGAPTSRAQLENYSKLMRSYGFHVLNYFNVTEFGAAVKGPQAVNKNVKDEDLWKNCNDFLFTRIADGILYNTNGSGDYYRSWGDAIVMDPGAKDYQDFLIQQAQRHIDYLPSSSGIGIDRMDWLLYFNLNADDGMSWFNNKPVRSLFNSWKSLMNRLGPLMHKNDKVIFVNPLVAMRLDMMKNTDGIYGEHTEFSAGLNSSAFLGLCKPVIAWTWDEKSLKPDPDIYLQRFLYLGEFPSAPVPDNNHEINPSEFADKWYLKYGPLFNSMIGRKWSLKPNVINVIDNNAKANLFEVPGGYVMPVVLADAGTSATDIAVNLDPSINYRIDAIQPGIEDPVVIQVKKDNKGNLILTVPLKDRCALVRFKPVK